MKLTHLRRLLSKVLDFPQESTACIEHQRLDDLIPQSYWDSLLESAFEALGGGEPVSYDWGWDQQS